MGKFKYTLKKDEPDERDYMFCELIKSEELPKSVDLRDKMPPVFNQFNEGSCTAQGGTADRMYMMGNTKDLSRQFLYNVERIIDGTFPEDDGSQIRTICKALNQYGICEESYLPYGEDNIGVTPSADAYKNAENYKISSYHRCTSISDMKTALAQGHCILIGITVYSSFEENVGDDGKISMPNVNTEQVMGGHCTLLVGYEDNTEAEECGVIENIINNIFGKKSEGNFILRNSWSGNSTSEGGWGDHGYGYLPYEVLEKIIQDAWVIIK
ncbi:C1 family peptidase [Clostridium sp.]|uniref:C1 family peptidase n=1 Tax=Clostridium sp. TaxID=1506 RepID=UPI0026060DEE|nr:C1 family peptidase [Clostridium sp.]